MRSEVTDRSKAQTLETPLYSLSTRMHVPYALVVTIETMRYQNERVDVKQRPVAAAPPDQSESSIQRRLKKLSLNS